VDAYAEQVAQTAEERVRRSLYVHPLAMMPPPSRYAWPNVCGTMLCKLRCHNTLPYGQLFRLATFISPDSGGTEGQNFRPAKVATTFAQL